MQGFTVKQCKSAAGFQKNPFCFARMPDFKVFNFCTIRNMFFHV